MTSEAPKDEEAIILEKREIVVRRLQERQEERLNELSRRKEENDKLTSQTETASYFQSTFDSSISEVKSCLSRVEEVPKPELADYFDEVSRKLANAQKFLTDSVFFISEHDLKQKQSTLNVLQSELAISRDTHIPRKKFAFKNKRKQASAKERLSPKQESSSQYASTQPSYDVAANEYRITDKTQETVKLAASDVENKDVVVQNLSDCHLDVKGVPSAIHLTDLSGTTVVCGPCSRSIFIERCTDCVFVLAAQQLRIHETKHTVFYIHVTSKAIIEDSNSLQFAPYTLAYEELNNHIEHSGLNFNVNNWDKVDDFNWLVKDKQSPNWSVLVEEERRRFTID